MGSGLTKYILIVGLNFYIKGLEKRIREDRAIATAITMLSESLTKKWETNTHLAKPDPISISFVDSSKSSLSFER